MIGLNCMLCPLQTEAASRKEKELMNQCVVKADDFKYWSEDSSTRQKIVRFVEEATNPASKNRFLRQTVATFDMDGTFYCETAPLYFQEMMFLHRALEDKKYSPDRKMAAFAKKIKPKILNKTGITASENKKLFEYLTKAYAGMTPEEYRAYVREFMQTNETGLTNLKRGEAFYLPMVEIISYLGNNGLLCILIQPVGSLPRGNWWKALFRFIQTALSLLTLFSRQRKWEKTSRAITFMTVIKRKSLSRESPSLITPRPLRFIRC